MQYLGLVLFSPEIKALEAGWCFKSHSESLEEEEKLDCNS